MAKKTTPTLIIGLVIALILLIAVSAMGGLSNVGKNLINPEPKNKVSCDIAIANPLFSNVKIESFTCKKVGDCFTPLSFTSFLGISDKGTVQLLAGNVVVDSDNYDLGETKSQSFTFGVCSPYTTFGARTINEKGIETSSSIARI